MELSLPYARLGRLLLAASALCLAGQAAAAVPSGGSPFGIEPSGSFEPATQLTGGGWQRLAASRPRGTAAPAAAPVVAAATISPPAGPQDIAPAAVPPALVGGAIASPATPLASDTWAVSPTDVNLRQLIEAWAPRAGWTAAPWELDRDVPIVATFAFQGDFKTAVRQALSATEITDYVVKPCFHSNNLVRVVKQTTKCDPSK